MATETNVDDLFTDLPKAEPVPVTKFAVDVEAAEAVAEEPAVEATVEEPKAEPTGDAFDDLFKPAPKAEEPAPKPAVDEDPFGTAARELPLRKWVDDTGLFAVEARLHLILDGQVRLLKTTGRTTTVPLDRLSQADRQYVEAIIAQRGIDASGRIASK